MNADWTDATTNTRAADMGILYNATLTPAMNDISVTSGNADGWVYAVAINVDPVALRTVAVDAARGGTGDGRRVTGDRRGATGDRRSAVK